jgi:hypothetical protein
METTETEQSHRRNDVYAAPDLLAAARANGLTYARRWWHQPRRTIVVQGFIDDVSAEIDAPIDEDIVTSVKRLAIMLRDPLSIMHAAQVTR